MYFPHLEIVSPKFKDLVLLNTHLEQLWTGGRWLEGPVWFGDGRYLVFSDIPNDRLMRFDETDESVSVFRQPAMNANGNTRDGQGRLLSCEHRGRRVSRTEHNGSVTTLVDQYQGRQLNSPNDIVVAEDGCVWFTDPTYGIDLDYQGAVADSELDGNHVYRFNPTDGSLSIMASDFAQPNGLAFSPDEQFLYVADSGITHDDNGPRHIRRFKVGSDRLSGGEVIAECAEGLFDGFRIDTLGHIWTSAGDGVHCLTTEGELLGKILIPEAVANICFGGAKRNRLFICATTSLYATYLNISGCHYSNSV